MATDLAEATTEEFDEALAEAEEMTFQELVDQCDEEGITESELKAIEELNDPEKYIGVHVGLKSGPQSKGWSEEMKRKVLPLIGGGETDGISASDKIWPKAVPCWKKLGSAKSQLTTLATDPFYVVPHPRSGVYRIKIDMLVKFRELINTADNNLKAACAECNYNRADIKRAARKMLGNRYEEKYYDMDFTEMVVADIDMAIPLGIPPALRRFAALEREAKRNLAISGAKSVVLHKRVLAEAIVRTVDNANERLESRRVLDNKHEVISVEKSKMDSEKCLVTYRDGSVKKGTKPELTMSISLDDFEKRVKTDSRAKSFKSETMVKLLTETDKTIECLAKIGIGGDDLVPALKQLKNMLRGQDPERIGANLRKSQGFRDGLQKSLTKWSDNVLEMAALKPRRDIIRKSSVAKATNPNRL